MAVYSISFEVIAKNGKISRTRKNRLRRILQEFPENLKFSVSSYLFYSDQDIDQINNEIYKYLDSNDKILICEITPNYCGSLSEDEWEWIDEKIHKKKAKIIRRNPLIKLTAS
ncbi:MAG: hypothetical protein H8E57_01330 [Candidatus Cloacimonetes bacterium]|nr:hypothetical protein [Candidatus Cloacimonadota bacterium]